MKATDLQINDWVHSSFFGKTRVTSLKEHAGYGWVMTSGNENWKSDASLSPVPLTAEILEKNGLKYEVDYGGYHRSILGSHSKDNEPLICVQWNPQGEISQWEVSNKSGILTGVVAYGYTAIAVHELQHILRMVGLDELANSIIV